LDEIGKVTGGYAPLEGAIGVLPVVDDASPDAKAFVERYRKMFPGRTPSTEVMLNYTTVWATAQAMKLAGTVSDAVAIRAQLDKAMKTLPAALNPFGYNGVDERGGTLANGRVAAIEGGKVKELAISSFK
jgi:branched-chain amino acid transport system substrate-binding protein